jgi:2'-5' RNA ligase/predicted ABC-type ATPase
MKAKSFDVIIEKSTPCHDSKERFASAGAAPFCEIGKSSERSILFIGLKINGADSLAIEGGEETEEFHVTLVYGHFDSTPHDESAIESIVGYALDEIRDAIPEEIHFDAIKRFPASDGSDGKDVIYAQVAEGQLEKIREDLLKAFKEHGMPVDPTFPEYKPHMTLAYIDPDKDHELTKIDNTGKVTRFMVGYGKESSHEHNYTILKTDNDKRLVFGWASISITADGEQLEDRQQDMIDPEDLEESVYEYVLNFRDTGEEHIPTMRKKGKLVESCVFTVEKQKAMGIPEGTLPVGWWIGFKIEDDAAWERVKNGTYRMFSIEGKALREPIEKAARNYDEFPSYDMWLEENLDATLEEQKAAKEYFKKNRKKDVKKMGEFDYIQEVGTSHRIAKTFDEILEIQKFNPYHDARGRFTSANGGGAVTFAPGKNRKYGQTDASDAAAEINGGKANSMSGYLDADGKLTPEREAVHKQIIDDLLKGKMPVQGQATMTMLGGGPASGKSSVMNPDTSNDKNAVTVDPDAFKQLLPGYKEMAAKDSNAASYYHEESSALAKRFAEVAFSENYNVIYDGTGDGSPKSVQKKIDGARANGYKVEGKYVSIDTEEAVRRNQKRYDDAVAAGKSPRLVPAEYVRSCHAKVTDISAKMAGQFDSIEIWDNNGARGQQKLIATGGGGKGLKAVSGQEAAFKSYLGKGSKGEAGFTTLADGTVIPAE